MNASTDLADEDCAAIQDVHPSAWAARGGVMLPLLCRWNFHKWRQIGTARIESFVVFGTSKVMTVKLHKCVRCGELDHPAEREEG